MNQSEFTGKAQAALLLAERCARQLHQSYVGSEHILVGLLRESTGVAARVLQDNGVTEPDVLELIRDFVAPENILKMKERSGYSKRAEAILEESRNIADKYHSELIGTEHILMAVIKENENEECGSQIVEYNRCFITKDLCGYSGSNGRGWQPD